MYARAARAYRQVDLESAPKEEILDRLYARFDRDVCDAIEALVRKDMKAKARAITHASRITTELEAALDHASSPELCANLESLYSFIQSRITIGSCDLNVIALEEAKAVMAELRDAFKEARSR